MSNNKRSNTNADTQRNKREKAGNETRGFINETSTLSCNNVDNTKKPTDTRTAATVTFRQLTDDNDSSQKKTPTTTNQSTTTKKQQAPQKGWTVVRNRYKKVKGDSVNRRTCSRGPASLQMDTTPDR